MTWLRPVDRTSGTLTLSAGTLSCLTHHGTPLSEALPHDDRAGTHDSADGRCRSYAFIGRGQSPRSVDSVEKSLSIHARRRIEYLIPAPGRADLLT